MKRSHSLLALLVAALAASPLLATPLDGRKKDPPKQEKPKPEDKKPVEAAVKTLAIGTELDPATSLDDCTGQPHLLKRYRGKIVVLDFWSTSSATNPQTKRLMKLSQEFAAKGVVVLAIDSVPGESADPMRVQDALKRSGASFPVLMDDGGVLAERMFIKNLDQVVVLDAKGIVRYSGAIDDDPKGDKAEKAQVHLAAALTALSEGKEVTVPTTAPNGSVLRPHRRKPASSPSGKR